MKLLECVKDLPDNMKFYDSNDHIITVSHLKSMPTSDEENYSIEWAYEGERRVIYKFNPDHPKTQRKPMYYEVIG